MKYAEAQKRFSAAVMAGILAAGSMGAGFTALADTDVAFADEAAIVTLDGEAANGSGSGSESTGAAGTTDSTEGTTDENQGEESAKINIADVTFPAQYCTYDGTAQEPFKKSTNKCVVNGEKTRLYEGTDYSVEYSNNIEIGTATAVITGMGNYTGQQTVTFPISALHFEVTTLDGTQIKDFSSDELNELAANSTDNKTDVCYNWGTSVDYVEAGHYITYKSLLIAAGVVDFDSIKVVAADGFGTTFSLNELEHGKYYPAQTTEGYSTEGAVEVPCVLALDYWTTSITTTAGEAVTTIKESDKNHVTSLRNYEGATEDAYKEGNIAGNRFVTGPTTLQIQNESAIYSDLSKVDDWAIDYVLTAIKAGYIQGDSGQIRPTDTLNRAEIVTILYRAAGSQAVASTANFTDTNDATWYQDAINWAVEKGIVTGYSGTTLFGTYDSVTRQDLATMVARFANTIYSADLNVTSDATSSPDWSSVSDYAQQAMQFCYKYGIITGYADTNALDPQGLATREQMAKIIVELIR